MQGQLTSAMMCDPPERLQFGFWKAEVPAITNTVDRQCSLVHPETHFVNPLLALHADGVKSCRVQVSESERPPHARCAWQSRVFVRACHVIGDVWIRPAAFWAIFPEVPPCAGKESLMACHSSGRIVTVPVYVSWDAEMFPPSPNPNPNPELPFHTGLVIQSVTFQYGSSKAPVP